MPTVNDSGFLQALQDTASRNHSAEETEHPWIVELRAEYQNLSERMVELMHDCGGFPMDPHTRRRMAAMQNHLNHLKQQLRLY
jgi:hypothetical protein